MNYINYTDALERFGDDSSIFLELAKEYLAMCELDATEFFNASNIRDIKKALYHVHKLKGASLTIGAEPIAHICGLYESRVRDDIHIDTVDIQENLFPLIKNSLHELKIIIADLQTLS